MIEIMKKPAVGEQKQITVHILLRICVRMILNIMCLVLVDSRCALARGLRDWSTVILSGLGRGQRQMRASQMVSLINQACALDLNGVSARVAYNTHRDSFVTKKPLSLSFQMDHNGKKG